MQLQKGLFLIIYSGSVWGRPHQPALRKLVIKILSSLQDSRSFPTDLVPENEIPLENVMLSYILLNDYNTILFPFFK